MTASPTKEQCTCGHARGDHHAIGGQAICNISPCGCMAFEALTSKTSLDSAWVAFLRDTASDRSTWEAFQYAWLARGDLDPTFQQLEAQCQAIWRTNVTLVCHLPKGHEGDHRCGRHTFNGECDIRAMRPVETARELSASESASFAKTLARSPRRVEPQCQHDLLKPKTTIVVDQNDPFHASCSACKHDFRTRAPLETSSDGWKCVTCGHENPRGTLRCQNSQCTALSYSPEKATALPPGSCTRCGDTGFLRIEGRTEELSDMQPLNGSEATKVIK